METGRERGNYPGCHGFDSGGGNGTLGGMFPVRLETQCPQCSGRPTGACFTTGEGQPSMAR